MAEEMNTPQALEYRTEVKQLLDILAHSLYTDREIFLRELISNASDALNRVQFEMLTNPDVVDPDAELAIRLRVEEAGKVITLADSGVGMNRDELIENLGTIAHSGARTFLQNAGEGQAALEEIIGQFGVGFYSVFMVADEVQVTTRSYRPEDTAWVWTSTGDSRFTLAPADKTTRGTEITIRLKDDASEFGEPWRLEQIVKRHSDYVSFPIYLEEAKAADTDAEDEIAEKPEKPEPRMINRRTALWRQSPSQVKDEDTNEFYKQLTLDTNDPLLHIHMVADAPVNLRTVLFVPTHRERGMLRISPETGLRLYSRKILIQAHNNELLPEFYRFVEGVVDSEDLPLNVSREMVQSNPVMRQIRRALTNRLNREFKTLAEEQPDRYAEFWAEFGAFLKQGAATDASNQEALVDLLRFHTSKRVDAWVSLNDYIADMAEGQDVIYYVLGEDMRSVAHSPHLDPFRARGLEVLYLVDPIDGFLTAMLREVHGKQLQNVDDAGLTLPEGEKIEEAETPPSDDAEFEGLIVRVTKVLGDLVRGVQGSKQLVQSPCRLVSPADDFDRDLQRLRRLTEEDYVTPKKLLELNPRHPTVVNLAHMVATMPDDPVIDASIRQLFDNALLLEGLHANPVDMVDRIQMLLDAAVASRVKNE